MLCEVKTINVSDVERKHRRDGTVRDISTVLSDEFFRKLKSSLQTAKNQMDAYTLAAETRKIAFVVINYDDILHEFAENHAKQIRAFIETNPLIHLEIEFSAKPPFYGSTA